MSEGLGTILCLASTTRALGYGVAHTLNLTPAVPAGIMAGPQRRLVHSSPGYFWQPLSLGLWSKVQSKCVT